MAFASAWTPVAAPADRTSFVGGRPAVAAVRPSAGPTMRNAISNDTFAPRVGLPTITPTSVPSRVGNPRTSGPIRAGTLLAKFRVSAADRASIVAEHSGGKSVAALALDHDVSRRTIQRALSAAA